MEFCPWVASPAIAPQGMGRIYAGEEGCPLFLKDSGFREALMSLIASGRPVTLVTPPLTEDSLRDFRELLAGLPRPVEVVCNDLGGFVTAARYGHQPIAGRILSRQNTDPACEGFFCDAPSRSVLLDGRVVRLGHINPPESLTAHWMTPPILSESTLSVLRRYTNSPVLRVEIDLPPGGVTLKDDPPLRVSAYTKFAFVSMLHCGDCARCPSQPVLFGKTRGKYPVYRRRNCLLSPVPGHEALSGIDRLILPAAPTL